MRFISSLLFIFFFTHSIISFGQEKEMSDDKKQIDHYLKLAGISSSKSQLDSALIYGNLALDLSRKKRLKIKEVESLMRLSRVCYENLDHIKSREYINEALDIVPDKEYRWLARIHYLIATIDLREYNRSNCLMNSYKALEYAKKEVKKIIDYFMSFMQ